MDENKLRSELLNLGCCNQIVIDVCVNVYYNLKEEKRKDDISFYYSDGLKRIYLLAKDDDAFDYELYLPFSTQENIPIQLINSFDENLREHAEKKINVVFNTIDSQCIFYRMEKGIGQPPGTETNPIPATNPTKE